MTSLTFEKLWPPGKILACPLCRRPTPGDEPADPRLFRCKTCRVPMSTILLRGQTELNIKPATGTFLFDPQSWMDMGLPVFQGELPSPVPMSGSIDLAGKRVEPLWEGTRVLGIVTHDEEVYFIGPDGKQRKVNDPGLLGTDLAMSHNWLCDNGKAKWAYQDGTAFDLLIFRNKAYMQHVMSLPSMIAGGENIGAATSYANIWALEQEVWELKVLEPMPGVAEGLDWDQFDELRKRWACKDLVLKDMQYFWRFGGSRAWMIDDGRGDL